MSNLAIEKLSKMKQEFIDQREAFNESINKKIDELTNSIKILSGENPNLNPNSEVYDDESPDYIKQSIEEI